MDILHLQVSRVRSCLQRKQRSRLTSLPCFTSKRRSLETDHLWKPELQSVLPSARFCFALRRLMTLDMVVTNSVRDDQCMTINA